MALQPLVDKGLSFSRLHDHTQNTTFGRNALDECSARRRDIYLTKKNSHRRQTSITPGGNQTRNPSKRAAADPRLCQMLLIEHINCNQILLYFYTEVLATTNQMQLRQLLNFRKGSRILTLFSGIKLGQKVIRFWDKRTITYRYVFRFSQQVYKILSLFRNFGEMHFLYFQDWIWFW